MRSSRWVQIPILQSVPDRLARETADRPSVHVAGQPYRYTERATGCVTRPRASSNSTPVACSSRSNTATGRGAAAACLAAAHQALRPLAQASLALVDGQAGRPRRARGRPLRYRHPRARRPERPHGGAVRRAHTAAGAGTTSLRVKLEAEGCWAPAPTYGRWACTRSAAEKLAHVLQTAWRAAAEPVRVGGRGPGARPGGAGEARAPPAGLPRCLCVPQC